MEPASLRPIPPDASIAEEPADVCADCLGDVTLVVGNNADAGYSHLALPDFEDEETDDDDLNTDTDDEAADVSIPDSEAHS